MATTLAQARYQLAMDAGVEGHKDFPIPTLNRYLNLAQKYIQKILNGLGTKQWERSFDCTYLLTNRSYYGIACKSILISGINSGSGYDVSIQPNSLRLIEVGNAATLGTSTAFGIAKIADEQVFHKILENPYQTPTIKEARFIWQDGEIILAPSTVLTALVHFYAVVKDLTTDLMTFEVPDEFIEQVIKRAQIDIFDRLKLINNKDEALIALDKEVKDQYQAYYNTLTQKANENEMSKLQ